MKVYTKIVYDKDNNIIEEQSFDYTGSVAQARKRVDKQIRSSKTTSSNNGIVDANEIKKLIEQAKNGT